MSISSFPDDPEEIKNEIASVQKRISSIRENIRLAKEEHAKNPGNPTFLYEPARLNGELEENLRQLQDLEAQQAKLADHHALSIFSEQSVEAPLTDQQVAHVENNTLVNRAGHEQEETSANQPSPTPDKQLLQGENSVPVDLPNACGTGKHWAVIVGISTYEEEASYNLLKVCDKDAETFYEQLVTHSFHPSHLRLITDHTLIRPYNEKILTCLQTTAQATMPDDLLLFYYSGFVDEDDNDDYLITRNSLHHELQRTALPILQIKKIMLDAPARAKIIILDICHAKIAISPTDDEKNVEKFIYRIYRQNDGVVILSASKRHDSDSTQSLFTSLLTNAFMRFNTRQFDSAVTVYEVCQELKNSTKLFLSLPIAAANAKDTVLYRHASRTSDNYLISAYIYVVKAYHLLEDMQTMLTTVSIVCQSTCERLLKALSKIDGSPPSESMYFSLQEALLKDRINTIHSFMIQLRKEISEMRVMCQSSRTRAKKMHQSILNRLIDFMPEIYQTERKLRSDLLPGEIDG